jgi:Doubled CXXCH motif (Paired_CXXCH_1)
MLRKTAAVIAIVGLMAGAAYAAGGAGTGVVGSLHDMNMIGGTAPDALGRACVFCHTPHNADTSALSPPLWNRADLSGKTMAPYAWVAPANQSASLDISDPLVGPTRLCMSCHDGVTAADSHGGSSAGNVAKAGSILISGAKKISDLSAATHPIGFLYDDAAKNRGAAEIVTSDTGFITSDVNSGFNTNDRASVTHSTKLIKDTMYGGYMTCASCHDVHNTVNAKPDATHSYNYFLYAKEEGSAICLSCHVK